MKHKKLKAKPQYQKGIGLPLEPDVSAFAKKPGEPRPWFSHRHINTGAYCLKKCSIEQFRSFADKLRILSELEWKAIDSSPRETNGYEMLPTAQLSEKPNAPFDKEEAVMVFRFGGAKGGRIAGVRKEDRFYILLIDRDFTLYAH